MEDRSSILVEANGMEKDRSEEMTSNPRAHPHQGLELD